MIIIFSYYLTKRMAPINYEGLFQKTINEAVVLIFTLISKKKLSKSKS